MVLPRRELALAAGVTPGLVTYYFPTELSLVEAVAKPVIDGYMKRLKALLTVDVDVRLTLRSLVLLLLEISRDNGALIDSYVNFVKQKDIGASASFLANSHADMTRFFDRCVEERYLAPQSEAFRQTVIWGICRTVAQSQELNMVMGAQIDRAESLTDHQADLITALLEQGFGADRR